MILGAGFLVAFLLLCYGRVRRSMVDLRSTRALDEGPALALTIGGVEASLQCAGWTKGCGGELIFAGDPETYFQRRVAVTDSELFIGIAYLVPLQADDDPEMEAFAYQPEIGSWSRYRAINPGNYIIDHDGQAPVVRPIGTVAAYLLTGIHTWYLVGSVVLGSILLAYIASLFTRGISLLLARRRPSPPACA